MSRFRAVISTCWHRDGIATHGLKLLVWMLIRAALQATTIILLARQLGADSYGQFIAVVAVSSFLTPFVGLGLSHLVLRNCARDPVNDTVYFGRAIYWWVCSLPCCVVISIALAFWLLPTDGVKVILCAVVLAELTASSLTELCARHLQAREQTMLYGAVNAGLPGIRLLALVLLVAINHQAEISAVFWAYVVSSLIYASLLWVLLALRPNVSATVTPEPMTSRSGLPFCFAAFAMKLQAEFNKPVLAQGGFSLVGTYNVAQRAVDLASLPLLALQEVLWPRLYAMPNPLGRLRRAGVGLLVMALALGGGVWLAAPSLPLIFGSSYAEAVMTLRMLAWLPLLQILRALLNFHAIHLGHMRAIGWAYIIGGGASVAGVLTLVPLYGLAGAAVMSYLAEIIMIIYLAVSIKNVSTATREG